MKHPGAGLEPVVAACCPSVSSTRSRESGSRGRLNQLFGWAFRLADLRLRMAVGACLTLAGVVVLFAGTPALWWEAKKGTFPPLRLKLALLAGAVLLSFGVFVFASGYYGF